MKHMQENLVNISQNMNEWIVFQIELEAIQSFKAL